MPAIQTNYTINPEPAPPRQVLIAVHVQGVSHEMVNEFSDKLQESAAQLAKEILGADGVAGIDANVS